MKKQIITTLVFTAIVATKSFGQWGNGTMNTQIQTTNGYVGIGTATPPAKLIIWDNNNVSDESQMIRLGMSSSYDYRIFRQKADGALRFDGNQPTSSSFRFSTSAAAYALSILNSGNVGIGTSSPTSHLHMVNSDLGAPGGSKVQWANFSGIAGQGNNDQLKIFHNRIATGGTNWNSSEIKIQRTVDASDMSFISFRSIDPTWGASAIVFGSGTTDHMKIDYSGRVAIGTQTMTGTHSNALLTVAGKMVAQSCYITLTGWADYVFANDYKVPNLYDVEAYYKANKHLPEIPSEKEIIEKGVDLAEMNKLLLKKIEEMTILMVKQQKSIDAQQKDIEVLKLNRK